MRPLPLFAPGTLLRPAAPAAPASFNPLARDDWFRLVQWLTPRVSMPYMASLRWAKQPERQAQELTQSLWNALLKGPVEDSPEPTKAAIRQWRQGFEAATPDSALKQLFVGASQWLEDAISQPGKLKALAELVVAVGLAGGGQRALGILNLLRQPSFASLPINAQANRVVESLGPLAVEFVKSRNGLAALMPPTLRRALQPLSPQHSAMPFSQVKTLIERSLEQPLNAAFDSFEIEPLAKGYLSQVHRATIDGDPVAVKVLKPQVSQAIRQDVALLKPVMAWLERHFPMLGVQSWFETLLDGGFLSEPNFTEEAANLRILRERFSGGFDLPRLIESYSSPTVLTTRWVDTQDLRTLAKSQPELAGRYVQTMLGQLFEQPVFHADPEIRNIPLNPKTGRFVLLDAGCIGRSSAAERQAVARLIAGIYAKDADTVAQVLAGVGLRPVDPTAVEAIAQRVQTLFNDVKGPLKGPEDVLNLLRQMAGTLHGLQHPIQLPNPRLLHTLATVLTVGKTLDPTLDVKPLIGFQVAKTLWNVDPLLLSKAGWTWLSAKVGLPTG